MQNFGSCCYFIGSAMTVLTILATLLRLHSILVFSSQVANSKTILWHYDRSLILILIWRGCQYIYGTLQYKTDILSDFFPKTALNMSSPFLNQYTKLSEIWIFSKTPKTVLLLSQQPNIAQRPFCIQNERKDTLYHLI